ncbi:hypothetical protein TKK_0011278 [Trichogramma kaykai]|uniref:C2H2-type domain-containing protein n=1 Tax=Trichogramma kaykai TaxID=54128 RepID=A0ABD2WU93_9HYME
MFTRCVLAVADVKPPLRRQINRKLSMGKYVCHECDDARSFNIYSSLLRHQRLECNKPPRFMCNYCNYRAKQSTNIFKHIKRMHPGREENVCYDAVSQKQIRRRPQKRSLARAY